MTDEEFVFRQDCREKKITGRSSYKRVGKRKGCTLPSDRLTEAQKKKLNGEVITVNMNKPCRWKEFKLLSKDIQEEYLNSLHERFGCTRGDVARMFGISQETLKRFVEAATLDIFPAHKGSRLQDPDGWEAFRKGLLTTEVPDEIDDGRYIIPTIDMPVFPPKEPEIPSGVFNHYLCEFNGFANLADTIKILKSLPWPEKVRIKIEVTADE